MKPFLQVENICKSYGDLLLFDNATFGIGESERVALVARNGSGKTTLLNIIAQKESADQGKVTFKNNSIVGFLEQKDGFTDSQSVLEAACSGQSSEEQQLLAKQFLTQLNITDFTQPVKTLSGGERKRVAIAHILSLQPNFLILDEPTNHLDIDIVEWLEDYLRRINITLLMVTHDRYFLDRICNRILEIDQHNLYKYNGNFSYFLEKREERIAQFNAEVERAQNIYRRELEWIRSTPSARTTKATARVKAFDDIEQAAKATRKDGKIAITAGIQRLGKKVIVAKNLCKSYGEKKIIDKFSYEFVAGEKIGIIGNNGRGKSTLTNLLSGEILPDTGHVSRGETVKIGYYQQSGLTFNPEKRVIDIITDIAEYIKLNNQESLSASQFLTQFLFPPPMQQVLVRKLSGGELRRLYLLTILIKQPNFLILDEPTNDLDLMTLAVLEEYLCNYQGSLLIISHDRYFLDKIVDHLFVMQEDGTIKDFYGNYSDYKIYNNQQQRSTSKQRTDSPKITERPQRKAKFTFAEQRELTLLSSEIEQLSERKKILEDLLLRQDLSHDDLTQFSEEIGQILQQLDTKELRWLELEEKRTCEM